ncbi:arsenate reductase ArsC [Gulbenkiania mobilis]|uniref:Arsenate reductase n=1 Tax=Gulbenkiania mobilis TaxID=397457 RepID=A0ABY2CTJ8_GULMO|nr:arsenate reductase [Gulbenkiania mobilis]
MNLPLTVLVLCTGNSARSILGEALFNHLGRGRFRAYSAGSQPTGHVHPLALRTLAAHGLASEGYVSKSWSTFAAADAPSIDIVITVCSSAAGEACPIWRGQPLRGHWGVDDPAAATGSEVDRLAAFERAYALLRARVEALTALPVETMDAPALEQALREIGTR